MEKFSSLKIFYSVSVLVATFSCICDLNNHFVHGVPLAQVNPVFQLNIQFCVEDVHKRRKEREKNNMIFWSKLTTVCIVLYV